MSAHFAAQSIVKKQETQPTSENENAVIYPDMAKFHPGGGDGTFGHGRAARQIEYSNGFEAGKAEAAEMYQQTIRVMETTLEALKSSMNRMKQDIETSHGEVVKQCLQSLLPELSQEILRQEMHLVISDATKSEHDLRLTVKLHPQNDVAKSFLQSSFGDTLSLIESREMEPSAVHFFRGDATTKIDPVKTAKTCLSLLGIECDSEDIVGTTVNVSGGYTPNGAGDREEIQEAS